MTFLAKAGPVFLAGVSSFAFGFLALRTSQSQRKIIFGPLLASWACAFINGKHILPDQKAANICVWFMLFYLEHIVNLLFIERLDFRDRSWRETYFWLFNARWIGTERSTHLVRRRVREQYDRDQQVTDQSKNHQVKGAKKPSRTRFALGRLAAALLKFVIFILYDDLVHEIGILGFETSDFSQSKAQLIRRVVWRDASLDIKRETLVRTWAVFDWHYNDFIFVGALHDVFALVFVGIFRLDEPEDWPRLFGYLSDVTSMRTWYSQFWHMLLYRSGIGMAKWSLKVVGKDKDRTSATRIFMASCVFLLSAINHLAHGYTMSGVLDWKSFTWWAALPLLLAVEEFGQRSLKALFPWSQDDRYRQSRLWTGRLWVFAVFFWAVVKFQYQT
ncbi:hypothetical protein B9Z65_2420 [Elsinoe australis]|uniref:Wax synthase domain-containing protein n=1 Tax=Elsinoe australis TaxID=40998 RepID=A0A2P7ZAP7_9PEZI|nr:hypothetical protein B9Z65_2420 [Elsinoe australis]